MAGGWKPDVGKDRPPTPRLQGGSRKQSPSLEELTVPVGRSLAVTGTPHIPSGGSMSSLRRPGSCSSSLSMGL